MDLEENNFKSKDHQKIATAVKNSAEKSERKKAGPFQSAMSMINFYENRGVQYIPCEKENIERFKGGVEKVFWQRRKVKLCQP